MKTTIDYLRRSFFFKTRSAVPAAFLLFIFLIGSFKTQAQVSATSEFRTFGLDTLIVYTGIPNGPAESGQYSVRVRSAASNNEYIKCLANITQSLWSANGPSTDREKRKNYFPDVRDWSHTYANLEMNSSIEVEITKLQGSFTKATVNPGIGIKAFSVTPVNGKITFFINKPGQVTIDINGQMDDNSIQTMVARVPYVPVHTISIFANPVIDKPVAGSTVLEVLPDSSREYYANLNFTGKTTVHFLPGVHDIGRNFKIRPNTNYYIPGDAIIYGTMNNQFGADAANVRIYGYGTISGDRLNHPSYDGNGPNPPEDLEDTYKTIFINNATNFVVEGVSVMNSSFHSVELTAKKSTKDETFCKWVKIVTWRGNGDGIGAVDVLEDSFIRTQDDCTYVKGQKKRCVFWTDVNGSTFMFAGIPLATDKSILIEDCDVIYARRLLGDGDGGRVFARREGQQADLYTNLVNVTLRNIRVTDPYQTLETFKLISTSNQPTGSYSGLYFDNITTVTNTIGRNSIVGWSKGKWANINFKDVVINSILKTKADFGTYDSNFVSGVTFSTTSNFPVTGVSIFGCPMTTMTVNATNQLATDLTPINATNKAVVWTSSNNAIATVSATGLITAKAAGSATITVTTVNGAKTAVCNVTVAGSSIAVTGVTLTGCPTASMNVNATQQLTATVAPTNATNKSVNWSSSNTAVATVSNTGLVTAIAAGSATITVTTVDGNKTAVCNVTVATSAPAQTPYGGANRTIPGFIEAEHYDEGVEGSAFHDDATKQGVLTYRPDDMVDVVNKTSASNGKAVGYTLDGEWLEYKVNATAGTYDIKLHYFCSSSTAGDIEVSLGGTLLTTFTNIVAQTSGTVLARTTIRNIPITGGTNKSLRLEVLNGAKFDIDAIEFFPSATTAKISSDKTAESESVDNGFRIYPNPVTDILNIEFADAQVLKEIKVFNAIGQLIYSAQTTKGSATIDVKTLNLKGVVMIQVVEGGSVYSNKVIIK